MLTRRTPLTLAASEDLANITVVDPATGVVPLYVIQNGTLYEYDSLDTTTAASAVCLVSGDVSGLRYKSGGITPPYSVLTKDTVAQPVSPAPTIGDAYLIPTGATGTDWAGKDGKLGIYSRAGWQFAISPIGRSLYVEDTNTRWYRNAAGTWVSGFGAVNVGPGGINITNILGAKASFVVKVENQTTNTPPASPVAPVAYIVGPAPAGGWSAYSPGDLAVCLVSGTFTRIVPAAGDVVYDKSAGLPYSWTGSAWQTANGELLMTLRFYTASATWTKPARLSCVEVEVGGGGANGGSSGVPTNGGASSFGSHCSATGGTGGTNAGGGTGGTGGIGSGGDINLSGQTGGNQTTGFGGRPAGTFTNKGWGSDSFNGTGGGGGGGGAAFKRILASALGSSETVTISTAAQNNGYVLVKEYTRA